MVCDEHIEVARGVGEQPELETVGAQELEDGNRVVEQLEVLRVLPRPHHFGGTGVGVSVPAHSFDDPLREEDPDLLVVVELGVALQLGQRVPPSLVVPRGVELEREAPPEAAVALGTEIRPGLHEREVDVEDDGTQRAHASSTHFAVSKWRTRSWLSNAHASVCAIVQPRARSRSSPSSETRRSKRCSTARRPCPSSDDRTIGAIANSRSPSSGFGSMASHGSRCAASTFSACRSWCRSTSSPCVPGNDPSACIATSSSARSKGDAARSHFSGRYDAHHAASLATV